MREGPHTVCAASASVYHRVCRMTRSWKVSSYEYSTTSSYLAFETQVLRCFCLRARVVCSTRVVPRSLQAGIPKQKRACWGRAAHAHTLGLYQVPSSCSFEKCSTSCDPRKHHSRLTSELYTIAPLCAYELPQLAPVHRGLAKPESGKRQSSILQHSRAV